MTCQYVKSISYPLIIIFLGMQSHAMWAEIYDITELQQPDTTSPAMTGFYNVSPQGESTPEDPMESGFATSASSDFDPERSPEEEFDADSSGKKSEETSNSEKKTRERRTILIRVKRKPPERDLAAQFQCERHGFYYTNDGRCILPAYGHSALIPRPLPEPVTPPRRRTDGYGNIMLLGQ